MATTHPWVEPPAGKLAVGAEPEQSPQIICQLVHYMRRWFQRCLSEQRGTTMESHSAIIGHFLAGTITSASIYDARRGAAPGRQTWSNRGTANGGSVGANSVVVFYDNYPLEPDDEGFVDIERIYCFDWRAFSPPQWERLETIFRMLPEPRRDAKGRAWFSAQENIETGYLHASVELLPNVGLQVYGTLKLETWQNWDRAFQSLADGLPMRDLK
jgi:hypothetical protein